MLIKCLDLITLIFDNARQLLKHSLRKFPLLVILPLSQLRIFSLVFLPQIRRILVIPLERGTKVVGLICLIRKGKR